MIYLILKNCMAQEVTAHFPSLQMTLNNDYKSASCLKGQNRQQSAKHYTLLLEQLMVEAFSVFNSWYVVGITNQREPSALVETCTATGLHLV